MTEKDYIQVKTVMTANIKMIDGVTSVAEAINIMRTENISSLVINRRGKSDAYGVLTVRDIAEKVLVTNMAAERVSAYQVMQKPVLSLDCDMNIKYAIRLLSKFGVSRALVMEDGEAIGIVTLRDMVLR